MKKQPIPSRTPSESETVMTEVVMPNDANPMGYLQGGRMMQWLDIASAVAAQTHSGRICVTASVDSVTFRNPAHVGDIIRIQAKVTRAFSTSMEIKASAWARKVISKEEYLVNEAFFTFVAIDDFGKPTSIPSVRPVSAEEKKLFNSAAKRKAHRL